MREPFHRLFFAVRPAAGVIPEIALLRDAVGRGRVGVADDRLHLTTWLFPDTVSFPADVAARAVQAMAAVPPTAFRVVLDRIVAGSHHVILVPSEPLSGFAAFQARLDRALRGAGLIARDKWRFSPHLTLLHGRYDLDQAIDPIGWRVEDIVLLDSIVGETRHEVVARWPLG